MKEPRKVIICEMQPEGRTGAIPVVVVSNHPRFVLGYRFDYGFLRIALGEGYSVTIFNTRKWKNI